MTTNERRRNRFCTAAATAAVVADVAAAVAAAVVAAVALLCCCCCPPGGQYASQVKYWPKKTARKLFLLLLHMHKQVGWVQLVKFIYTSLLTDSCGNLQQRLQFFSFNGQRLGNHMFVHIIVYDYKHKNNMCTYLYDISELNNALDILFILLWSFPARL